MWLGIAKNIFYKMFIIKNISPFSEHVNEITALKCYWGKKITSSLLWFFLNCMLGVNIIERMSQIFTAGCFENEFGCSP